MKILDAIKAYYSKPHYEKSGTRIVAEMISSFAIGILIGLSISQFIEDLNPLWLLLAIPGTIHLILLMARFNKISKERKERNEAFKKEHDGVDVVTYCKQKLDETEAKK